MELANDFQNSQLLTRSLSSVYSLASLSSSPTKYFISHLQLAFEGVDLSFRATPQLRSKYKAKLTFNPMQVVLDFAGAAFGNIDEAPLRLSQLTIENAFGSPSTLVTPIMQHYQREGLREAYKVVGSIELLGNPVGLVRNLGTGVKDFIAEPAKVSMVA